MRWDDIAMWGNVNRFAGPNKAIPIPANGDPYTQVSETTPKRGMDYLEGAIDSIWGTGTYNGWYSKNKSAYISGAKQYYEEGNELEGLDGGHARVLAMLLAKHKKGGFVEAHEYEGLILHAIDRGKMNMEEKLYYMVEGVTAKNPKGATMLSFDRIAHINSEMLPKFPILEYLTAAVKRPDGKTHKFTLDDYKQWAEWFDGGNPMNVKPTKTVTDFLWKYVLSSDETRIRINKDLRDGKNIDHEDAVYLVPPATEQIVTDTCRQIASNKALSSVGYANVFPGFGHYIRAMAENSNYQRLGEAIKSYVRFESIMTDKYEKGDKSYHRIDSSQLNSGTVVTPNKPPSVFIKELNTAVQKVIAAYPDPELQRVAEIIYNREPPGDIAIPSEKKKQTDLDYAYEKFGEIFSKAIKTDNGEKMKNIIEASHLSGMN
jgi:hypothetical protein